MIEEINEYVKNNKVDSSTRIEMLKGDGWSLQLVGDGYLGEQLTRDSKVFSNDSQCSEREPNDQWVCTRPVRHGGPHVASVYIEPEAQHHTFISVW